MREVVVSGLAAGGDEWTMPIHHWREALNHFTILWPDRMPALDRVAVMNPQNPSTSMSEGRGAAPSLAHPSPKINLAVYTEKLTYLQRPVQEPALSLQSWANSCQF